MSAIDADVVELLQSGGVGRVGRAVVRPSHPHMPATDAETSDARAVARRFIDLFNARDHDALCEVIAEDAEFSTVGGEPRRGPDGARDLLRVAEERDLRLVPLRPGEVEEDDGRVRVTLPVRELIGPDDIERVAELEIRDGRVAVFALRKMV
jgi:hypothetical protein